MALQDDDALQLPPSSGTGSNALVQFERKRQLQVVAAQSADGTAFYFKPVEGNMAYHTVLGEQPIAFDLIAKPFVVKGAEWGNLDQLPTYRPDSVTVVEGGQARTCSLSHLPFDLLAQHLLVWSDVEASYHTDDAELRLVFTRPHFPRKFGPCAGAVALVCSQAMAISRSSSRNGNCGSLLEGCSFFLCAPGQLGPRSIVGAEAGALTSFFRELTRRVF